MHSIRPATREDAQAILDIYSPYIDTTSLTFETDQPSLESFAERITNYLHLWPWLVYEQDGIIAGYAYGSRYRERTGYQWCVETSVYVKENLQRKGIATQLYRSLMTILQLQGYRNVYAVVNLPNEKSIRLHEACGFTYLTTYQNVGYKLGQWKHVGWWQLQLNDYSHDPAPPTAFSALPAEAVSALLTNK
jgi:phosphinothricin acetyltransferase